MIKNNFGILVADRLIKMTDIANATGISRTTLTNLYQRRNKGISFDTLNTLCMYLDCQVSDMFTYIPDEEELQEVPSE